MGQSWGVVGTMGFGDADGPHGAGDPRWGGRGSHPSSPPHGARPRRSLQPPLRTSGPSTSSSPSPCRRARSQVRGWRLGAGGCGARWGASQPRPPRPPDPVAPGEVRMPSGKTARPNITDNKDGTVTVRYAPTEKGLHEMDIRYDGNHIPGEAAAGTGGHWEPLGATGRGPGRDDATSSWLGAHGLSSVGCPRGGPRPSSPWVGRRWVSPWRSLTVIPMDWAVLGTPMEVPECHLHGLSGVGCPHGGP